MHSIATPKAIARKLDTCACTPVLIDPELLKHLRLGIEAAFCGGIIPPQICLCKVQLASNELELDAYGIPVPKDWKTITLIVAAIPKLEGYSIVDHWQALSINEYCPF